MDNVLAPQTSTTAAQLPTHLAKWSRWLRPDSEAWEAELIAERHLDDLDGIAMAVKAEWSARATPAELEMIFRRLAAACRGQPGEANDRKATAALFLRYLSGYPAKVLSGAVDDWILTQTFMPSIADLKKLIDARLAKLERTWRRAESLAAYSRNMHRRRREDAAREAELVEDRRRNLTKFTPPPIQKQSFRHPHNRDTDTPEEKARIAEICRRAREQERGA